MQSVKALKLHAVQWAAILVYRLLEKLDAESRKHLDLADSGADMLTFKALTTFMDSRGRALESSDDQSEASTPKMTSREVHREAYSSTVDHSASCQMKEWNWLHSITQCDCAKQLGTRERKTVAIRLNLCTNFLRRHSAPDCLLNSAAALATTDIIHQCTLIVQSSVNIRWTLCASVNNNGWH